ncbi:universal stress protein [Hymenobacter psychrotolerans]|uniref:Universal stress protein family protein n=1 Tax=Hymenobacter psychrotolerans DSM 18569 TaxID=1121959 RepID=A0A1M6V3V6_9BACT|nr:universal stress protein [Hymenobacter psychrotolerans]SHK75996.1 Universal stress protein family protein [Hymenobacter psychrotolerans DSM 18569]
MKRIVIPTDLSLYSVHLIRYALNLLQGQTCHITLLQLTPLPDSITDLLTLPRPDRAPLERNPEFGKAIARLQRHYALEIEAIQVAHLYYDGAQQLKQYLQELSIDLVLAPVPLTRPAKGAAHLHRLLTNAPCPVLYIPEYGEASKFRRIAVVLDVEAKTPELPEQALMELLSRNEARLTFLLVFKPGRHTDQLQRTLGLLYSAPQLAGITYSVHLVQQRDVTEGVLAFLGEFDIDLVVASEKKRVLGSLRAGSGSAFRQAAITAKVPCLAVA